MKNQSFLPSLQVFRAIAALMVVFHHLWHEISFFYHLHSSVADQLAAAGKNGVDFFFVLSGFIRRIPKKQNSTYLSPLPAYIVPDAFVVQAFPGVFRCNQECQPGEIRFFIAGAGSDCFSCSLDIGTRNVFLFSIYYFFFI